MKKPGQETLSVINRFMHGTIKFITVYVEGSIYEYLQTEHKMSCYFHRSRGYVDLPEDIMLILQLKYDVYLRETASY